MTATVAFGPESKYASWQWVGADTAIELRKYFQVKTYGLNDIPCADIVFVIKNPLTPAQARAVKIKTNTKIVYVPVDFFEDEEHIRNCATFLGGCDLIVLHSESLCCYFQPFAPVRTIDHHGKFFLPQIARYKDTGFALWVGALQHLPFLLYYLEEHRLDIEIRILTDIENRRARRKAREIAQKLNTHWVIEGDRIRGMQIFKWSEDLQAEMLAEAKAAIDIKGKDFNQRHKPPTKAQKYICSGIPLAMGASESVSYFTRQGLDIPLPTDPRWLSREYYEAVCGTAMRLRPFLSCEAIGNRYKYFVEELLGR